MTQEELSNECFHAAVGLVRGDVEEETYAGPLYITQGENGTWDVYIEEGHGGDKLRIYTDTVVPTEFGSAGILGAYLVELAQSEDGPVNLPKPAGMMGQLIKEQ